MALIENLFIDGISAVVCVSVIGATHHVLPSDLGQARRLLQEHFVACDEHVELHLLRVGEAPFVLVNDLARVSVAVIDDRIEIYIRSYKSAMYTRMARYRSRIRFRAATVRESIGARRL